MSVEVPARVCEMFSVASEAHNLRDNQRAMVLACVKEYSYGVCDRQISIDTGVPVHLVSARRNELVAMCLVDCGFKAPSPFSKIRVKFWRGVR